ncbi:hypothetical protein RISK_002961 [Rhodopirellula islandica]|uniref:Uncharacterized protein n=1 Tax=Rhodopirellula islandica TaxID=595434 RepID=A0A0J1BEG6_RHOIS|nr:hypothetical protein [Rhodopirellula islandica]KLU04968.1 hypothetical protein RISK_002961 [Rhodopirellula islandica]
MLFAAKKVRLLSLDWVSPNAPFGVALFVCNDFAGICLNTPGCFVRDLFSVNDHCEHIGDVSKKRIDRAVRCSKIFDLLSITFSRLSDPAALGQDTDGDS